MWLVLFYKYHWGCFLEIHNFLKATLEEIKLDLNPVLSDSSAYTLCSEALPLLPQFRAGGQAFGGHAHSSCFPFPSPSLPASCPRNSTDAVVNWGDGEAHSEFQAQLLIVWRLKGKFLQKGGKENKELRLGQLFSKARTLSWKTRT